MKNKSLTVVNVERAERIAKRFVMQKNKFEKHLLSSRPELFTVNRTKQGDCTAMNSFTGIRIGRVYDPSSEYDDKYGHIMPKEHSQDRLTITRGYAKLILKQLREAVKSLPTDQVAVIDFDTLTVWDLQDNFSNGVRFETSQIEQDFLKDFRLNAHYFIQCLSAVLTLSTSLTITIGKAKDNYAGDTAHKPLTIDGDYGNVKTLLMPVRK